jgi:glycosyltransferase involved in cell wall biosynthesis
MGKDRRKQMTDNEIKVSIVCNTYNHEKYIRDTLDSFVMQKTNFPFEILIHDDASTDSTVDIIREYEAKYPQLFNCIYQTENQYSKGGGISDKFQFPRANGDFVAICEGDDYWTDENKLQKQYDAMMKHPECDICAHRAQEVFANTKEIRRYVALADCDCVIPTGRVLDDDGTSIATNSMFIRKSALLKEYPFRKILTNDYCWQVAGALRGGLVFLNDCMSAYRFQADGSWTVKMAKDIDRKLRWYGRVQELMKQIDIDTNGQHHKELTNAQTRLEFKCLWFADKNREALNKKYRKFFNELSVKHRIRIIIKAIFPFVGPLWKKINPKAL